MTWALLTDGKHAGRQVPAPAGMRDICVATGTTCMCVFDENEPMPPLPDKFELEPVYTYVGMDGDTALYKVKADG